MKERIVTQIPLAELWDTSRVLPATRLRYLEAEELIQLLTVATVKLVIANVGDKLNWVDESQSTFWMLWKKEIKEHLHREDKPYLKNYPGQYFYFASEWVLESGEKVVLLEKYH